MEINNLQYPLIEKIGDPDLLVGREEEFKKFHQWIDKMPKRLSKSWAILGRRKSGKTTFVQRLFNQIWSANGPVIPFYFSVPDTPIWYLNFALNYYRTFASHYISFLERDPKLVSDELLTMEQIRDYGQSHDISVLVNQVNSMLADEQAKHYDLVWDSAYRAPHRIAAVYDQRILVMIDEFQYLSSHIYRDKDCAGKPVTAFPGSFHEVSESKVAPMLATGSYVGWMVDIMGKYLEAGRLSHINFYPYLSDTEGLQAVYKYADFHNEPITNETAVQINELCLADPFFISCVIQSRYPGRHLTRTEEVIEVVNYEVADHFSELSGTWREYIDKTVDRINEQYGKRLLLHLSKYNDRYWTPRQLKKELQLEEDEKTIQHKLISMVKGDLIEWGSSDIRFRGLQDGTLNLILRHRFEEEIAEYQIPPDLRISFREQIAALQKENQSLRGKLNQVMGVMAEYQFANTLRSRKRFKLGDFFAGNLDETELNLTKIRTRIIIQRDDGKTMELDIIAESNDGPVLLVEVRKRQTKSNRQDVEDFQEKIAVYQAQNPKQNVLAGFLSLGGFTQEAQLMCEQSHIGWAETFSYF
jgi:GTPase SAR1 family protein